MADLDDELSGQPSQHPRSGRAGPDGAQQLRGYLGADRHRTCENTVSLFKYAIAAAGGYYAAQPGARRQVEQLWQNATDLVRSPKATELPQRGREIVGGQFSW